MSPARGLLTTPVSPVRLRLVVAICALLSIALLTAWVAKVDIYAVAPARLQPTGGSNVIQPLETSRVRAVHVRNGASVRAGDLLIELDSTMTAADRDRYAAQIGILDADIARRSAEMAAARNPHETPAADTIVFDARLDAATRGLERKALLANLAHLRSSLSLLDARIAENRAQQQALQSTLGEQEQLAKILQQRVGLRQAALTDGRGSTESVLDAQKDLGNVLISIASLRGERFKADVAIGSITKQKEDVIARFIADDGEAELTAQAKRAEVAQSLLKALARDGYTRLVAPMAGTVQELDVTSAGQVVVAGQKLMTVVSDGESMEAQALVSNRDIGFVEQGQRAVLKLDSFPYTRYGTLSGKVSLVSRDAVSSPLAAGTVSEAHQLQVQNLVYPITIALDRSTMSVDGRTVRLIPGMSATVEIRTGKRRVIDYLLSPFREVASGGLHER